MQTVAKMQTESGMRKMCDKFKKVEKKDVVKLPLLFSGVSKTIKTGLSYKYKITTKREYETYSSEILHDASIIALILLPKRSK